MIPHTHNMLAHFDTRCRELSEALRQRLLTENPRISKERYKELFWPAWTTLFNAFVAEVKPHLSNDDFLAAYSRGMDIGAEFLKMDPKPDPSPS